MFLKQNLDWNYCKEEKKEIVVFSKYHRQQKYEIFFENFKFTYIKNVYLKWRKLTNWFVIKQIYKNLSCILN